MSLVLPKEIGYSPSLPALPECSNIEIVASPVNGNSFKPGQLIQFDLINKGYMDPSSLYIRYKYTLANSTTTISAIRGTPVYTFFQKLETIIGSQVVESVNDYNVVANMWTNLQYDVAMKYGNATAFGWSNGGTQALDGFDGRACLTSESGSLAAPLPCILSLAEKLVPLGFMPNVRVQLTTESIANAFFATAGSYTLPTDYTLANVELCYNIVDFNGDVNQLVQGMGDEIFIKSTSFQTMSQYVAAGAQGSVDLIYNTRLASVKSLFATFSDTSATRALNGKFDSVDITSSNGDMVFSVAGTQYPSRMVSTLNNRSAVMMELRKAVGALHSTDYNFSINAGEFNHKDNSLATTATSLDTPAKFWFGVNCEKLSSSNVLLSGISTQQSPVSLRINLGTATTGAYNITLIALHDVLISVNPHMRDASVKK